MGGILPFDKVVEIVHKTFGNENQSNIITKRKEIISDKQLEEMVNEAYSKFKTRIMNNSK